MRQYSSKYSNDKWHPSHWMSLDKYIKTQQLKECRDLLLQLGVVIKKNDHTCPSWGGSVIDGIKLHKGVLYVEWDRVHIADLIHEASHLLSVKPLERENLSGWLKPSSSDDGGEYIAQVIGYRITEKLGLDHATHLSVIDRQGERILQAFVDGTHKGYKLMEEQGINFSIS